MSTLLQKAAVSSLSLLVAFMMVGGASVAQAASLTQTQIDSIVSLLESFGADAQTVADVRTTLEGGTPSGGGSGSTGSCDYTFATDLSMGDTGSDVMNLQKVLNMNSATQVASSGVGSAGNETSYFGSLTKSAVVKFQEYYMDEVLSPVGLSAGTGYVGPSTRAQLNVVCASGTDNGAGNNGQSGSTSGVSIMAATQPVNSLAPTSAAHVPFTKFTITNNGASDATVDSVTVELTGLADKAAFSSVELLDANNQQLGNTRILNSNKQATVGESVTIPAGSSKTFTVAANMGTISTTYAGQVAQFAVVAVNTSAAVSGSLPIVGASHTLNGSLSIGDATVARGPNDPAADDSSEEIGTTGYTFTGLKITAGSAENIRVHSVRFNQSGSASASDLANVKVVVDGAEYMATVSADGKYYTVNFGAGIVINKGLTEELVVKADIVGGTNRTIAFDMYKATDMYITGETYGYGITADDGNITTSGAEGVFDDESTPVYDAYDVTISAGTLNSVSKSSSLAAGNIAEQVADTPLGAFTVDIKGEGITVQTVKFAIDTTESAGSDVDADDITNITLVDHNGMVLSGPVDGSAAAYTPTGGSAAEGSVSFSSVSFPAGVTTVTVKGQLGSDFDNNDTVTIRVNPTDWTSAIGDVTGDTITLGSSLASANAQTVKTVALSATTLTEPSARSVVKGTTDYVWAIGLLDAANSGEDVKITTIVINDDVSTTGDDADVNDLQNVEIWANLSGGSANDSTRGDRFEAKVSDTEQFAATAAGTDATLSLTLSNQFTVAKNTSVEVAVVGDLSSNAVGTAGTDTHTVDLSSVTASGMTTGTDASDSSVAGTGQAMTIAANGALTVSVDSSSPTAKLVIDDTTNEQTLGIFRLASTNVEDLDLDEFKITDDGTTSNSGEPVQKYVFYHGSTKLGEVVPTSGTATLYVADGLVTVPADDYVLITVKGVMNNITTNGLNNEDTVEVTVAAANTDVKTTGKSSGSAIYGASASYDAGTHIVVESYPTFAFDTTAVPSGNVTLSANQRVAKIVVTNTGDKDVTFQSGDSSLFSIQVQVVGDDTDTGNETITLKDQDGTTLDTGTINSASGTTQIDFDMSSVGATVGTTIPAGESRYFTLDADTSDLEDTGDLIQIWLDDVAADVTYGIDGSGDYEVGNIVNKGDVYGPAFTKQGS